MDSEECAICQEPMNLPFTLACGHTFCYLCIKRAYEDTKSCPYCRTPIREDIYTKARLQGEVEPPEQDWTWCYAGAHGGYWRFDPQTDVAIEKAYQEFLVQSSVSIFRFYLMHREYEIDFTTMKQRLRNQKATRDVLRLPYPIPEANRSQIKGIAGLRFDQT